jgi:ATP-dependent DNA helicase RecG
LQTTPRGIAKITSGFKNEGLKIPVFETTMGGIMVTIERPGNGKKLQTKDNDTNKVVDKVVDKLTNNQKSIIEIIKINPSVSARELVPQVGISHRKIQENIAKLKEYGIIERIGSPKGGHWEIINQS